MLQVARLAPNLLQDAGERVVDFLSGQMNPDGGFKDRAENSDLYYTVFGAEAWVAMRQPVPSDKLAVYLKTFNDGISLDLVHLACLARGWANLPPDAIPPQTRLRILEQLPQFRSANGGYDANPGAEFGTLYGCFLTLGAYQDLREDLPNPERMVECIHALRAQDGGYANQRDFPVGLTPSTAAAVALLRQLDQPVPADVADWLLSRCRKDGGFFATPDAPIPDLLSTATALHALACIQVDFAPIKEPCLDFLDTLWTSKGAFFGTWEDDGLDCEYTYYGLLAMGHLSL
jgi:prenyltransferase beta subunit